MRFYGSFGVANDLYASICVLMGPCVSLLFFVRPYGSL